MTLKKIEVRDNNNQIIMIFEEETTRKWLKECVSKGHGTCWGKRYTFTQYLNHLTAINKRYFRKLCNGTFNIKQRITLMVGNWYTNCDAEIGFDFNSISKNTILYFDDCTLTLEKLFALCKICNKHTLMCNEQGDSKVYFLDPFEFISQKVACRLIVNKTANCVQFQLTTRR